MDPSTPSKQAYGTQSDAFAVDNDLHRRSVGRPDSKFGLGAKQLGEDGGHNNNADDLLEAMGYKAELLRSRSTLQVAFMSFVLASIPYGLATTLYYPLVGGGPTNIIWGWVTVSLIILCVAASLGEITSVYPTSGGVYYQTFMLAPSSYRLIMSWICGWAFVVGNITITLAVNFGTTLFFAACINVFETEPEVGIFAGEPYQIYLIFFAITLLCNAVSALGNRWLPWLDTFAIFWTFAGLICIAVCVLAIAANGRNHAAYVFGEFDPSNSGWPAGWSFCVGLLHAAYATSSTGMIISMCEEVRQPATQVPKAMVATIVLNTLAGLVFLVPLVFVMPDQADLAALVSAQPTPVIIKSAIGSSGGTIALLLPLLVLALFCGIGCTTASSRCTWAFARDGAIPGARWWKQVNEKLDIPLNAMMMIMVVELALGLIYFGSSAAFNAFSGVGVICLTMSYACPILVNMITGRSQVVEGNFYLGRLGWLCNIVSICWSALALPLFCMPTAIPVVPDYMNYASVVFFAFFVVATVWYFVWGKQNYQGPPIQGEAVVLEARRESMLNHEVAS